MRIWSLHPVYLDTKGLVALWREGLLGLHVLSGKTKGYLNHPQLSRFKAQTDPVMALATYLHAVVDEAEQRGYAFQRQKLPLLEAHPNLVVTQGQLEYEVKHLLQKLSLRDAVKFEKYRQLQAFDPHPLFTVVEGTIEPWEKIKLESVSDYHQTLGV